MVQTRYGERDALLCADSSAGKTLCRALGVYASALCAPAARAYWSQLEPAKQSLCTM